MTFAVRTGYFRAASSRHVRTRESPFPRRKRRDERKETAGRRIIVFSHPSPSVRFFFSRDRMIPTGALPRARDLAQQSNVHTRFVAVMAEKRDRADVGRGVAATCAFVGRFSETTTARLLRPYTDVKETASGSSPGARLIGRENALGPPTRVSARPTRSFDNSRAKTGRSLADTV